MWRNAQRSSILGLENGGSRGFFHQKLLKFCTKNRKIDNVVSRSWKIFFNDCVSTSERTFKSLLSKNSTKLYADVKEIFDVHTNYINWFGKEHEKKQIHGNIPRMWLDFESNLILRRSWRTFHVVTLKSKLFRSQNLKFDFSKNSRAFSSIFIKLKNKFEYNILALSYYFKIFLLLSWHLHENNIWISWKFSRQFPLIIQDLIMAEDCQRFCCIFAKWILDEVFGEIR